MLAKEFDCGILLFRSEVHVDSRGHFFEGFNQVGFSRFVPNVRFVQDNHSRSGRGVLRGLHYQLRRPQGKLIRILHGEIFDVAVDLRRNSPWFGKWTAVNLNCSTESLWIPPGFAHGFLTLSESADLEYKTTDYYCAASERTIAWNDRDLGVPWPLECEPMLSDKDQRGIRLKDADVYDWHHPFYATLSDICPVF